MPQYRLYFLGIRTGRIESHEQFEARDDEEALSFIQPHVGDHPLELWTGGRRIARFDTALALSGLSSQGLWGRRQEPEMVLPETAFGV
jgi:hypothetical protein